MHHITIRINNPNVAIIIYKKVADELKALKEAFNVEDLPSIGQNLNMENGTAGWSVSTTETSKYNYRTISLVGADNTNGIFSGNQLEIWGPAETEYNREISQTINNIENGDYEVSASVMAVDQGHSTSSGITGKVELFACSSKSNNEVFSTVVIDPKAVNDAENVAKTRKYTLAPITISDGNLKIGIRVVNSSCNWLAFDNVVIKRKEASGILNTTTYHDDKNFATKGVYNLQGCRINKSNFHKRGIYIINGKKVVLKP